jgi:hypothetical protein
MKKGKNMKRLLLNKTVALFAGILFSTVAGAQTADSLPETDWAVYDENDAGALAQYLETSYCPHEILIWGAGGVSSLTYRNAGNGFGGAFGVGYTYFLSGNWGLSSGLEYAFYQGKINLNGFAGTIATFDILNHPVDYNTRIDHYRETQFAGLLNLPLTVQYQTGNSLRFYASAGLKLGLPVSAKYSGSDARLTASGYYPEYNQTEVWQNDLGYGVLPVKNHRGNLDLNVSITGTLETGVKWDVALGVALYTGVFVDYGFNSLLSREYSQKPPVEYNRVAPEYPVMNTACVLTDRFAPFSFGVKVKVAFPVGCRDRLNSCKAYEDLQLP